MQRRRKTRESWRKKEQQVLFETRLGFMEIKLHELDVIFPTTVMVEQ